MYKHEIHPTWTPIQPISKDIQVDSNSFHIIIITQFPSQLATTHTIHQAKRLTLDYLTFDPTNIYKHGLTFITFSHVKKRNLFTFCNLCK
jgi:hypothetical protein